MLSRKIIVTLEISTDVPLSKFNKKSLQDLFDNFESYYSELDIHQVTKQAVKGDK